MDEVKTFSVRFDERTKQILISVLDNAIQQTASVITAGDYSEQVLNQHEELTQVKRGILYTRPDEPEEVKEPEAEPVDNTGGVEMYKSQGRPQ